MQSNSLAARGVALGLVFVMTGCESSLTYRLWKTDEFRHVREPATNPYVTVFYSPRHKDYLIGYDSVLDGGEAPRRAHYFVGENHERIVERQKPKWISTNRMSLQPLPINQGTNVLSAAVVNGMLVIYTQDGEIGPYPLPIYPESTGTSVKAALTPLAVAGDVACVGAILALIGAYVYAGGCINCGR